MDGEQSPEPLSDLSSQVAGLRRTVRGLVAAFVILIAVVGALLFFEYGGGAGGALARRFDQQLPGGAEVHFMLQYKPEGCMGASSPIGCYYFALDLSPPHNFDRVGKHVSIKFYDASGFSLYRGYSSNALIPGWNTSGGDYSLSGDTESWQGRFHLASLPLASFKEIDHIEIDIIDVR